MGRTDGVDSVDGLDDGSIATGEEAVSGSLRIIVPH